MRVHHEQGLVKLLGEGSTFSFDGKSGALVSAARGGRVFDFTGLLVDAGLDGAYARGQMAFDPLFDKRTWELPAIRAVNSPDLARFLGFSEQDGALIAAYETPTSGYGVLNLSVYKAIDGTPWQVYVKGENLTNRLGLVNTSFIKNVAPIQGRSLTVGVRAEF